QECGVEYRVAMVRLRRTVLSIRSLPGAHAVDRNQGEPMKRVIATAALAAWCAWPADILPGDARRGEQLFQSEHCIECHSFKGRGGTAAPDLAQRIGRDYTPAVMTSLMWNHAPQMWPAMTQSGLNQPALSPQDASDLFAYFVSARYFERRGDAARG